MTHWLPALEARLRRGLPTVRVAMAAVRGSAPREPGASMLVGAGYDHGTIGGGQLELRAMEIARTMLERASEALRVEHFKLGEKLGQCCGGAVDLWFERFEKVDLTFVSQALLAWREDSAGLLLTHVHHDRRVVRTLHRAATLRATAARAGLTGTLPAMSALLAAPAAGAAVRPARIGAAHALIERLEVIDPALWVFGAGHVGRALAGVMAGLPFRMAWVDSRRDAFPAAVPPPITVRHAPDPVALVDEAGPGDYFLVLTHSHALDYDLCRAILDRGDFGWAGLIGSETKAACFQVRLARDGIAPERIARLVSPIGIAGIGSKLPAAIAVAVAAQLLQVARVMPPSRAPSASPPFAETASP